MRNLRGATQKNKYTNEILHPTSISCKSDTIAKKQAIASRSHWYFKVILSQKKQAIASRSHWYFKVILSQKNKRSHHEVIGILLFGSCLSFIEPT
jgi:hypothetical protein